MAQLPQALTLKALLENPDLLNPPKPNEGSGDVLGKKIGGMMFSQQTASLIPTLWDKTYSLEDEELNLELVDFDDIIDDNILNASPQSSTLAEGEGTNNLMQIDPHLAGFLNTEVPEITVVSSPTTTTVSSPDSPVQADVQVDFNLDTSDVVISSVPGEEPYDPRKRRFNEEELRPQPMIKKSKKTFVPEEQKDECYWKRRHTNNLAAKRSRDAHRIKMNQISLRTAYLEKENGQIKQQLAETITENKQLKRRISLLLEGATG